MKLRWNDKLNWTFGINLQRPEQKLKVVQKSTWRAAVDWNWRATFDRTASCRISFFGTTTAEWSATKEPRAWPSLATPPPALWLSKERKVQIRETIPVHLLTSIRLQLSFTFSTVKSTYFSPCLHVCWAEIWTVALRFVLNCCFKIIKKRWRERQYLDELDSLWKWRQCRQCGEASFHQRKDTWTWFGTFKEAKSGLCTKWLPLIKSITMGVGNISPSRCHVWAKKMMTD